METTDKPTTFINSKGESVPAEGHGATPDNAPPTIPAEGHGATPVDPPKPPSKAEQKAALRQLIEEKRTLQKSLAAEIEQLEVEFMHFDLGGS